VSSFRLNRFEVTVGRFRKFVEDYDAFRQAGHPQAGEGANPRVAGTGWLSEFNAKLPANAAALKQALACEQGASTWTDAAGPHEHRPINCVDWYMAFAFCAWDGSWLPTATENNYARSGGDEQRDYPWSAPNGEGCKSPLLGMQYASYECGIENSLGECIFEVGAKPLGDGRWGHADLAGNLWEWNFDYYDDFGPTCNDCALTTVPANPDDGIVERTINGCGWPNGSSGMCQTYAGRNPPEVRQAGHGFRCALLP
jgi:sulfatase modifying factor 1